MPHSNIVYLTSEQFSQMKKEELIKRIIDFQRIHQTLVEAAESNAIELQKAREAEKTALNSESLTETFLRNSNKKIADLEADNNRLADFKASLQKQSDSLERRLKWTELLVEHLVDIIKSTTAAPTVNQLPTTHGQEQ